MKKLLNNEFLKKCSGGYGKDRKGYIVLTPEEANFFINKMQYKLIKVNDIEASSSFPDMYSYQVFDSADNKKSYSELASVLKAQGFYYGYGYTCPLLSNDD